MIRRAAALGLALMILLLTACAPEPVPQGMVTAEGTTCMTFVVSTVTDEKAGTVTVTVSLTNGSGDMLYLSAPEVADADGKTSAAYLSMSADGADNTPDGLTPTGVTRRLAISPRETYSESCTFTMTLPTTLTVAVSASTDLGTAPTETQVEFDLK